MSCSQGSPFLIPNWTIPGNQNRTWQVKVMLSGQRSGSNYGWLEEVGWQRLDRLWVFEWLGMNGGSLLGRSLIPPAAFWLRLSTLSSSQWFRNQKNQQVSSITCYIGDSEGQITSLNNASLYLIFPCELIDMSVREKLFLILMQQLCTLLMENPYPRGKC